MTIRDKVADWISGGRISLARQALCDAAELFHIATQSVNISAAILDEACVMGRALQNIAAMETPSANATVRRMAKEARKALK